MKNLLLFALFTYAALLSSDAPAAEKTYRCEVLSDAYIQSNGELSFIQNSPRIGQEFAVIKKGGEVIGDVMDSLKNPKILVSGVKSNAYKVIWMQKSASKDGAFIDYLSIDESVAGNKKPFGFFSGALLMTGVCE